MTIHVGDCLLVMPTMDAESVDAIVTDPPYGLEFMGKAWDTFKPTHKQPKIGEGDGSPHRRNRGTPKQRHGRAAFVRR